MSIKISAHSQWLWNGNNNYVFATNKRKTRVEWQGSLLHLKTIHPCNWPDTPEKVWFKMGLSHKRDQNACVHVHRNNNDSDSPYSFVYSASHLLHLIIVTIVTLTMIIIMMHEKKEINTNDIISVKCCLKIISFFTVLPQCLVPGLCKCAVVMQLLSLKACNCKTTNALKLLTRL